MTSFSNSDYKFIKEALKAHFLSVNQISKGVPGIAQYLEELSGILEKLTKVISENASSFMTYNGAMDLLGISLVEDSSTGKITYKAFRDENGAGGVEFDSLESLLLEIDVYSLEGEEEEALGVLFNKIVNNPTL